MDNKIKGCVNMRIISAKIYNEERKIVLNRPILAFSKIKLSENEAIINPKILG